jgi:hypothetical protein
VFESPFIPSLAANGTRRDHVRQGVRKMARLNKTTMFNAPKPRAETLMDKTTRVVNEIRDSETELREAKIARLRKARLEREAGAPVEAAAATPVESQKKPRAKAV